MSTLHEEIEQKSKEIITDNYSMSVGEIISMYKEGDLDIHPEFQRFFRWSDSQKSRLIESFLLNFPVPPIFVYQRTDGVWDIVDGLQRVSTILQFAGIYKNEDGEKMAHGEKDSLDKDYGIQVADISLSMMLEFKNLLQNMVATDSFKRA